MKKFLTLAAVLVIGFSANKAKAQNQVTVTVNLAASQTLVVNNAAVGGNRNTLIAQTAPPGNLWYGKLYYRTPVGTDPAYVIRMAELYFIRSEARAQQGNLTGVNSALSDLNAVRNRAGIAASTASTLNEILLALENERRVEFPFEGDRW
ncbi:MAG: RagB/SusD family nutrient uptake outer membrane protein, partial [Pedobacter sp.]